MPIDRFNEIFDLLEQYMEEWEGDERWVTVQEFRNHFNLNGENGHIIAAFLSGLMYKPIFGFPFIVYRVERIKAQYRSRITPNRYLVMQRRKNTRLRYQKIPLRSPSTNAAT
jgi:hypothetical protein